MARWDDELGVWVACRFTEVDDAHHHTALSSLIPKHDGVSTLLAGLLLHSDPPDHTTLRRVLMPLFSRERIEAVSAHTGRWLGTLLAALAGRERFDLLNEIARPFAVEVAVTTLDVPDPDVQRVVALIEGLSVRGIGAPPSAYRQAERCFAELTRYVEGLIAVRGKGSTGGPLGAAAALAAAANMPPDRFLANVVAAPLTGIDNVTNLVAEGALALLRHPEQLALIRMKPATIAAAVEEMVRWCAPAPSIGERIATTDLMLGDVTLPAGAHILLDRAAANRDPAVYGRPEEFDIRRPPRGHLGFGSGAHYCIGAGLARTCARRAFEQIIRCLSDLALDEPYPPRRMVGGEARLTALPVRRTPPAGARP